MTEENEKIIDHSLEYATELLKDTGEFYPFGAYLGNEGIVHPLEFEFDKKNMPTNGQVIDWLENFCKEELENKQIKAYGITYDVTSLELNCRASCQDFVLLSVSVQRLQIAGQAIIFDNSRR